MLGQKVDQKMHTRQVIFPLGNPVPQPPDCDTDIPLTQMFQRRNDGDHHDHGISQLFAGSQSNEKKSAAILRNNETPAFKRHQGPTWRPPVRKECKQPEDTTKRAVDNDLCTVRDASSELMNVDGGRLPSFHPPQCKYRYQLDDGLHQSDAHCNKPSDGLPCQSLRIPANYSSFQQVEQTASRSSHLPTEQGANKDRTCLPVMSSLPPPPPAAVASHFTVDDRNLNCDDVLPSDSVSCESFVKYNDDLDVGVTPADVSVSARTARQSLQTMNLRPVSSLPEQLQKLFAFEHFNSVQSEVFDDVLYSDQPLVVSAPTGSGKTVIFELAIIRLLMQYNFPRIDAAVKVVYMAPIKALCSERFEDWKKRFGQFGLKCMELTGDSMVDDYYQLQDAHIILTTPEKWDHMTRRWVDNKSLVHLTRLFLIDEVHLLSDSQRGATLEVVISRMKTVQLSPATEHHQSINRIRFIAVSATIPNIEDIAEWLSTRELQAISRKMDDSYRPVKLRKVVLGYPCRDGMTEFRFDMSLSYRLANVIQTYAEMKPTLVFCSTRKSTIQTAGTLVKEAKFLIDFQKKKQLQSLATRLRDSKLQDLVMSGVGYHHAGLDVDDRKLIESMFAQGNLAVLVSTSTLAMGVNLPAHLVVIKSTQHYAMGVYQEYTETQILQMIGRAGRPQFDTSATVVIMTRMSEKVRYESLLQGNQPIESSLHEHLIEHLNAEVTLGTITGITVSLDWLRSTFLYIRVNKHPQYYNLSSELTREQLEYSLQEMCLKDLNMLASMNLISMEEDGLILKPTETGRLMTRFCVAYETMKNFQKIGSKESIESLLKVICDSHEFSDVQLRMNEKRLLNALNKDKTKPTIRFPMNGKIKTAAMKVNCLIQSQFCCLSIQDFTLLQEVMSLLRIGTRIAHCLVEILWLRNDFTSLLNAVLLAKCFRARLWENSQFVAKQLSGIGITLATVLVNAGLTSFEKIAEKNPRDLELLLNRQPPFGNHICDAIHHLPQYDINIQQSVGHLVNVCELQVTVNMVNVDLIKSHSTAQKSHTSILLIGDVDNQLIIKAKISDAQLLLNGSWHRKVKIDRACSGDELHIHLISQDWAGIDVRKTFLPTYTGGAYLTPSITGIKGPAATANKRSNENSSLPAVGAKKQRLVQQQQQRQQQQQQRDSSSSRSSQVSAVSRQSLSTNCTRSASIVHQLKDAMTSDGNVGASPSSIMLRGRGSNINIFQQLRRYKGIGLSDDQHTIDPSSSLSFLDDCDNDLPEIYCPEDFQIPHCSTTDISDDEVLDAQLVCQTDMVDKFLSTSKKNVKQHTSSAAKRRNSQTVAGPGRQKFSAHRASSEVEMAQAIAKSRLKDFGFSDTSWTRPFAPSTGYCCSSSSDVNGTARNSCVRDDNDQPQSDLVDTGRPNFSLVDGFFGSAETESHSTSHDNYQSETVSRYFTSKEPTVSAVAAVSRQPLKDCFIPKQTSASDQQKLRTLTTSTPCLDLSNVFSGVF